jgi:hypothetical protein
MNAGSSATFQDYAASKATSRDENPSPRSFEGSDTRSPSLPEDVPVAGQPSKDPEIHGSKDALTGLDQVAGENAVGTEAVGLNLTMARPTHLLSTLVQLHR